jgi:hypothetical protein
VPTGKAIGPSLESLPWGGRGIRRLRALVLVALGGFAVVSVGKGIANGLQPGTGSQDLAPVYRAAKLWVSRHNPYVTASDDQWRIATGSSEAPPVVVLAAYSTPYPPIALLNASWLCAFGWSQARIAWMAFNLLISVYLALGLRWLWPGPWSTFGTAALVLWWHCGIGLRVGLGLGQHELLVFACILTALVFHRRDNWLLSGLFLALSLHKFTWTAFVVPYFVVKRDVRPILSMILSSALLLLIFLVWPHASPRDVIAAYARELAWWGERSKGGGLSGMGTTHLYPVLRLLLAGRAGSVAMFAIASAGLLVACYAVARIPKERDDLPGLELTAFLSLSLWATYHGLPDTVLLILPLLACVGYAGDVERAGGGPRLTTLFTIVLGCMWVIDPTKIARLSGLGTDHIALRMVDVGYRLAVLLSFCMTVWQLTREGRSLRNASGARGPDPAEHSLDSRSHVRES